MGALAHPSSDRSQGLIPLCASHSGAEVTPHLLHFEPLPRTLLPRTTRTLTHAARAVHLGSRVSLIRLWSSIPGPGCWMGVSRPLLCGAFSHEGPGSLWIRQTCVSRSGVLGHPSVVGACPTRDSLSSPAAFDMHGFLESRHSRGARFRPHHGGHELSGPGCVHLAIDSS